MRRASSRSVAAYHQKPVDGQRLNVDARPVHQLQALRSQDLVSAAARTLLERRAFDDIRDVDDAVTMNVDHAGRVGRQSSPAAERGACRADTRSKNASRPITHIPVAAPARVLTKCLRLGIVLSFNLISCHSYRGSERRSSFLIAPERKGHGPGPGVYVRIGAGMGIERTAHRTSLMNSPCRQRGEIGPRVLIVRVKGRSNAVDGRWPLRAHRSAPARPEMPVRCAPSWDRCPRAFRNAIDGVAHGSFETRWQHRSRCRGRRSPERSRPGRRSLRRAAEQARSLARMLGQPVHLPLVMLRYASCMIRM